MSPICLHLKPYSSKGASLVSQLNTTFRNSLQNGINGTRLCRQSLTWSKDGSVTGRQGPPRRTLWAQDTGTKSLESPIHYLSYLKEAELILKLLTFKNVLKYFLSIIYDTIVQHSYQFNGKGTPKKIIHIWRGFQES